MRARVVRAERIAAGIVGLIDALLIYVSAWHFLGWWGFALAFGLYGKLTALCKRSAS